MNRFNKKIILFVFSALFIIYGFLGYGFNIHKGLETLHEEKEVFLEEKDIKKTIDRLTNDDLWYHDSLIDINSLNLNLMNNRIVNKGGSEFVKTESGKLSQYFSSIPDIETLNDTIDGICDLYEYASNNKCCYLYVVVPSKSQYEEFPPNAPDYSITIYSDYVDLLSERGVPFLNCVEALKNNGIADSDVFFDTDHHWKPYSGFVISKSICESLAKAYGFIYSKEYTDINNFDIETYKDHFLGSTGKKIGQYFSWKGVDDFDLIIPKFGTDFVETVYDNGETREGNYCDTILHMNNMEKNLHHAFTYSTYCGGDYRLQVYNNRLNASGPKIMVIRTSYACVVTPFLALQASELHIVDDREGNYPSPDKVEVFSYIEEIKPDYIIEIKCPM